VIEGLPRPADRSRATALRSERRRASESSRCCGIICGLPETSFAFAAIFWVNPQVAGNGGVVFAEGRALHGFPASAEIVIPANGVVVFVKG